MKKTNFAALLAAGALLASANASAVVIDGVNLAAGSDFVTTTLWEKVLTSVSDKLEGVGIVRDITGPSGSSWTDGANNTQLTYYFKDFSVGAWYDATGAKHTGADNVGFSNAIAIDFVGGKVSFYSDRVSTGTVLNPSASMSSATDIAKATDGNLWADYVGDTSTLFTLGLGVRTGTLFASVTGGSSIHVSGTGLGYLDIIGGLALGALNTNGFNPGGSDGADALLDSSYSTVNPAGWDLSGSATLKTTSVPEPASLALVGLGLMGLAAMRKKS